MEVPQIGLTPWTPPIAERAPRSRSRVLKRSLHVAVAVCAVAAAVAGWLQFDTDPALWQLNGRWLVTELIPGIIAFAIAGAVLLRYPKATAVGWTMLACALSWGLSVLLAGLFVTSLQGWNSTVELFVGSSLLSGLGLGVAYGLLPQVYPDGLLSGWLWRTLFMITVVLVAVPEILPAMIHWGLNQQPPVEPVDQNLYYTIGPVARYAVAAIVAAALVERWRRGPRLVRQQVGLFALVWAITMAAQEVAARQLGDQSEVLAYALSSWPPVAVAIVAVAVVQYRLYDIQLVIRRVVIYGIMALILTGVFAAVYVLVLSGLSSPLVRQEYRWVAVVAAVAGVLAADPLRHRLRAALQRRLLGARSEPLRSLARLDALVAAGTDDEHTIYRIITETAAEAVRAPGVVLAMHRGPVMESAALSGAESADALVVPLLHRSERLGELRVSPRTPGESYGRADLALLDQLASQAAALVYGLRRDRDIATLRTEAIEAMAEQRTALGRDLHDGLAPLLAGAGLTADALRRGMPEGSPDAEEAGRLATRLRNAASEVRQIAHNLQPTGTGTAGLAGLIEDQVASLTGPSLPAFTLHLDDLRDRRLPGTLELGMYRVALEAINNVARHAHAAHAEVSLRTAGDALELIVSDDGVGIIQPYVSGLGITSMRSRVQVLGGSFDIAPGPGGGTRLIANVPVSS